MTVGQYKALGEHDQKVLSGRLKRVSCVEADLSVLCFSALVHHSLVESPLRGIMASMSSVQVRTDEEGSLCCKQTWAICRFIEACRRASFFELNSRRAAFAPLVFKLSL